MTNKKSAFLNESNYWWLQRLLSILLIPLFVWFSITFISFATSSSEGITLMQAFQYLGLSVDKYIFLFFSIITFLHISLGIEEVIDDYVHSEKAKLVASVLLKVLVIRLMNEVYIFYIS